MTRNNRRFAPSMDCLEGRQVLSNVAPTFTITPGGPALTAAQLGAKVDSMYQWILHRADTPAERTYYVNQLERGETLKNVAAGFLNSPEFNQAHPIPGDYIQALYVTILDRVGYSNEVSYWLGKYGSGVSRSAIVAQFLNSPEALTSTYSILSTSSIV